MTGMPRMFQAITAGFNAVTSHIYLILFPIGLDLLLWFGPHLRVKAALQPFVNDFNAALNASVQPDMKDVITTAQQAWQALLDQFNLLSGLRSFPVGVPSLMAAARPLSTPLGAHSLLESPSIGAAVSSWLLFSLIGLLLGSYYFHLMGRLVTGNPQPTTLGQLGWETMQSVLLVLLLVALALGIGFPVLLFVSFVALFSIGLAQLAMLIIAVMLIWVLLPLVFSAHGIFVFQLDTVRSTLLSFRLVRSFLPGTGLFLMLSFLISQGLDMLWRVPPDNSWMALVGILGHAFISTSLVAASFIYYAGGVKFMQERLQEQRAEGRGQ